MSEENSHKPQGLVVKDPHQPHGGAAPENNQYVAEISKCPPMKAPPGHPDYLPEISNCPPMLPPQVHVHVEHTEEPKISKCPPMKAPHHQ